jgi:hypothetical protein
MRRPRLARPAAVRGLRRQAAITLAVRQARRLRRSGPTATYVCWDLDNTLVSSGENLALGMRLEEAIVEARPVPNMLAFYGAMQKHVDDARHFILSARTRSMRRATIAWLRRNGIRPARGAVCFVPTVDAKPLIWDVLGRSGRLVIIDDLSYDHESGRPSVHGHLVEIASRTACRYVGFEEIHEIATNPDAIGVIVAETLAALDRC